MRRLFDALSLICLSTFIFPRFHTLSLSGSLSQTHSHTPSLSPSHPISLPLSLTPLPPPSHHSPISLTLTTLSHPSPPLTPPSSPPRLVGRTVLLLLAMGRVGEVITRTWQTADKMKRQIGQLPQDRDMVTVTNRHRH